MSKNLYCPKCKVEYWGEGRRAVCNSCKYVFTNIDKQKALGLNDFDYKIWLLQSESCRRRKNANRS
jgi:hypothetical protein|tara:strand:- start:19 stop:216 length:198 start_codon:yes stop_codon:yes gene_type:complete